MDYNPNFVLFQELNGEMKEKENWSIYQPINMIIVVDLTEEIMQVILKFYQIIYKQFLIQFNFLGHTIVAGGKKYAFHLLPSGMLYSQTKNILGNGTVINIPSLFEELKQLENIDYSGRLLISDRAHIVTNISLELDGKSENDPTKQTIGTTRKGIGPAYAAKKNRIGLRIGDLKNWENFQKKYTYLYNTINEYQKLETNPEQELRELKHYRDEILSQNMIIDPVPVLSKAILSGKRILAEGANALMLDIDYGTYPYVTSSNTSIGGVITGMSVPPSAIETTIGIVKAYTTRVGEGAFPTEQLNEAGEIMQTVGREYGVTTGRKRRCGWLDIPVLKYGQMLNNYSSINLTKLDILSEFEEIKIGANYKLNGKVIDFMPSTIEEYANVEVEYVTVPGWKKDISGISNFDDLPQEAKNYIKKVEELSGVPVSWVGTGPERESIALQN
ncbi:P-loop containing nucleoside triphosphate hydrolase [Pseudocohnilembus persalinus]|uniref:Adenylosuccinate synthetase n=1 Tax=Pseudocohnilembus persalinus TaxID=266149 RepID=A0A0V0QG10_PSEPJ|nr:P-loop containing nucleoside triphosphate hydrolase [Pseudocohnilembus persalinus]|eukprot:KRX01150.1 P-loop containing nucleoside triphosphate hydrolase [Pseudocohnilembus persalinus]